MMLERKSLLIFGMIRNMNLNLKITDQEELQKILVISYLLDERKKNKLKYELVIDYV